MERQIPVRLHEAQYNKLKKKAEERQMSMAEYIRVLINKIK